MKKVKSFVGRVLFWLSWPFAILYINGSRRTRLLLVCGDQALVVKGWVDDGRWGLPGGGIHKNEVPLDGLIREVGEETSLKLDPKNIKSLGVFPYRHAGFDFECHYFYSTLDQPITVKPHLEIRETKWMNLDKLTSHNAAQDVIEAIALVRGN